MPGEPPPLSMIELRLRGVLPGKRSLKNLTSVIRSFGGEAGNVAKGKAKSIGPAQSPVLRKSRRYMAWIWCDRLLWFEPLHEPRYRRLTGGWRDGVTSLLLNEQLELILRPGIGVGLARACGAIHQARHRRSRVRIAVDHKQRAWRDEREHLRPVKLLVDAGNHSVIKLAHEVGVDFRNAGVFAGAVDRRLESLDARLPTVVLKRPAEALYADARHGDSDARIDGRGQVGLHAAFGKSDQPDAICVHIFARLQVIDQPQDIPHCVVKKGMLTASAVSAQDGFTVLRRALAGFCALAVITAVNRHPDEAETREFLQESQLALLIAARAGHPDHHPTPAGGFGLLHQDARHALLRIRREGEMRLRQAVSGAQFLRLRRKRRARAIN